MTLFKRGKTWFQGREQLVDIRFEHQIIDIDKSLDVVPGEEVIDLDGTLIIPGGIDPHVHFNDPGFTEREDFLTGTTAAAYGGITTIIDMPCTSLPPIISLEALDNKLTAIAPKALIDYALWGGIRGNDLLSKDQIDELWERGVVGFKIYTISGMETFEALSYRQIEQVFQLFKGEDVLFGFHAEDADVIYEASRSITGDIFKTPEGYLLLRPAEAEIQAINEIVTLAKQYQTEIHIVHVSTKIGMEQVATHEKGSCETSPHYLQYIGTDLNELKGRLKTAPVVKESADRAGLRAGLVDGRIAFVSTDHAGCDYETEKCDPDFSKVYNGIPGTQMMIPYLFSEFYVKEGVSLDRMIEISSANAAKRFGLYPRKGVLQPGSDADFTILSFDHNYVIDESDLKSKGQYTPFYQELLSCSVVETIVRGETVYRKDEGILVEPGYGTWIRRNAT